MGITGLLPLLKKASKNSHVRKFSGCTVAIDAYCWLHKGAFGCADKLGKGEPTTAYITYCMKYIQVLLDNNIKPILVLDGRNLPSKAHTEKKRREKREENRRLARKYLQEGNKKGAWECFTKSVDITPAMAREFIKELRKMKIDYVIAPYEADAQLAYLAKQGIVDIVITEDSDLILFGCPKIFFKMSVNGDGVLFDQAKLPQALGLTPSKFQFDKFRWMCIMSGCDYLPSLPGIGLGRAQKVVLGSTQQDIRKIILSIPSVLDKLQIQVPDEYIDQFIQADNTFLYQLVFDTKKRTLVPLTPYPVTVDPKEMSYAGSYENKKLALGMALGNIDIKSLETVDNFDPIKFGYTNTSMWSPLFNPNDRKALVEKGSKDGTHTTTVGMQLSVSLGSALKKKRPLAAANLSTDDENVLEDNDLMNMYAEQPKKSVYTSKSRTQVDLGSDAEDFKDTSQESPAAAKRRRLTQQKTEGDASPSCNTRSKTRVLPFRKSPENGGKARVVVKSKYFRSEEDKTNGNSDSVTETDQDSAFDHATSNLSIYSFESNSECATSNSNSQHSSLQSQENYVSVSRTSSAIREITISDGEDDIIEEKDEAYGSSGESRLRLSNSFTSKNSFTQKSFSTTTATNKTNSTARACRRQGLSKSTKNDPKQRSVRDMFVRQSK